MTDSAQLNLVDVETLAEAIRMKLGKNAEEATGLAEMVMSYFGFDLQVIDNALDPEDRKMFYSLHDAGILSSAWEESLLPNGRLWRIYYWELNVNQIRNILSRKEKATETGNVYDELPTEAWMHH
ncbi:MAG: hypothetical protein KIY12_05875 [Thermoplasmata archaeon]|uniref:Uncharacterized protein n=1 Tax=Candidatus Sysuiplasma superficiale TaxID=2823368 RepID=A0A8J7YKH0_9ARCH|nr:hypothetical protein [Candidatus Sysuiplasma superficiale]MBX8644234.1 hypothetical protein [Candidatus Sysuiplasma superficiale]